MERGREKDAGGTLATGQSKRHMARVSDKNRKRGSVSCVCTCVNVFQVSPHPSLQLPTDCKNRCRKPPRPAGTPSRRRILTACRAAYLQHLTFRRIRLLFAWARFRPVCDREVAVVPVPPCNHTIQPSEIFRPSSSSGSPAASVLAKGRAFPPRSLDPSGWGQPYTVGLPFFRRGAPTNRRRTERWGPDWPG